MSTTVADLKLWSIRWGKIHLNSSLGFISGSYFIKTQLQFPSVFPSLRLRFFLPSHLSFIDRGRGAVACWALRLDEGTIRIQRCIIDHTVQRSSLCAPSLFFLFLYWFQSIFFSVWFFFFHAIHCCAYQWKDEQSCTQEEMRMCLSHEEVSREASLQWGDMTHAAGLYCWPPIKHSVRSSWFTARITLPLFSALCTHLVYMIIKVR